MHTTATAALLLALASSVLAAGPYTITANGVNCRKGPTTKEALVREYQKGDQVTLVCQTEGQTINGTTLWGKTSDSCFVSDWYIKTGTSDYVVDKCDTAPEPPTTRKHATTPTDGGCTCLNAAGVALIKGFELFVPNVYNDRVGNPTVGYGHLCQMDGCSEVPYSLPLSEETGTQLLNDDIRRFTSCLNDLLTGTCVTFNDNQWAALASWTLNVGCKQASDSDLIARIKAGEDKTAVVNEELPLWKHAGGQVLLGLVRRRAAEVKLSNTPSDKQAFPKCE